MPTNWYRQVDNVIILTLHVQPDAKQTEVTGLHGDALKIRLTTSPIEGRANAALLKYLAKLFDVPASHVILKYGEQSRHKMVEVRGSGINPESILRSLNE